MFKIRLIKFDDTKKVPVIKQVKDVVENINLVQVGVLVIECLALDGIIDCASRRRNSLNPFLRFFETI